MLLGRWKALLQIFILFSVLQSSVQSNPFSEFWIKSTQNVDGKDFVMDPLSLVHNWNIGTETIRKIIQQTTSIYIMGGKNGPRNDVASVEVFEISMSSLYPIDDNHMTLLEGEYKSPKSSLY